MPVRPEWRVFTDVQAAKQSILKRYSLRDYEAPDAMLDRSVDIFGERIAPEEAVRRIIRSVRDHGDSAIHEWNRRIDNIASDSLRVSSEEMDSALRSIAPELRRALEHAAERIRRFHEKQPINSWIDAGRDGSLGQLIRPVDSVGAYVPGGTAPLPSSLLMSVIPAQVGWCSGNCRLYAAGQRRGRYPSSHTGSRGHCWCGRHVSYWWRASDRGNGLWQPEHPACVYHCGRRQSVRHARQAASLRRCRH